MLGKRYAAGHIGVVEISRNGIAGHWEGIERGRRNRLDDPNHKQGGVAELIELVELGLPPPPTGLNRVEWFDYALITL